jgi:hypothetical protein
MYTKKMNKLYSEVPSAINSIKILESPHREILVRKFIKYLRDNNKIVIELDRVLREPVYCQLFYKIHLNNLFFDPHKYVCYRSGVGFSTATERTIPSTSIKGVKFFNTYFYLLFSELDCCKICASEPPKVICVYCTAEICERCVYNLTSVYFVGNNIFRCPCCRALNTLDIP